MSSILDNAAELIFRRGTPPEQWSNFVSLTKEDKAALIDGFIKTQITQLAKTNYVEKSKEEAVRTAQADADVNLKL